MFCSMVRLCSSSSRAASAVAPGVFVITVFIASVFVSALFV